MPSSFFDKLKDSIGVEDIESEPEEEREEKKGKPKKEKAVSKAAKKIAVKDESKPEKKEEEKKEEKEPDWFEESDGELAVDVYQTDDEIVIQSTIAGVKPEDLDISIENDTVIISGERQNIIEDKGKNYFYQECFWGAFSREIILPEEVDGGRAEATMKEGVFTLRIPKIERKKIKKIKVRG